jgi:hypothetical protein
MRNKVYYFKTNVFKLVWQTTKDERPYFTLLQQFKMPTDYIFIQLFLVKHLFQTKKRNCFLESDFRRETACLTFYNNLHSHTIFSPQPLFSQQKQKEFEFSLHEYSKRLSPFDDFSVLWLI